MAGYYKRLGLDFERKDLLITNGGSEAINMLMTAILNEGDEVIMAEPFYTNYKTFVGQAGAGWWLSRRQLRTVYQYAVKEKIEKVISDRTRAICIINPGNPTGKELTRDEMKLIVDIALAHDLFIIADEVYREFVYDGKEMTTFGSSRKQRRTSSSWIQFPRILGLRRQSGLDRFQKRRADASSAQAGSGPPVLPDHRPDRRGGALQT